MSSAQTGGTVFRILRAILADICTNPEVACVLVRTKKCHMRHGVIAKPSLDSLDRLFTELLV